MLLSFVRQDALELVAAVVTVDDVDGAGGNGGLSLVLGTLNDLDCWIWCSSALERLTLFAFELMTSSFMIFTCGLVALVAVMVIVASLLPVVDFSSLESFRCEVGEEALASLFEEEIVLVAASVLLEVLQTGEELVKLLELDLIGLTSCLKECDR